MLAGPQLDNAIRSLVSRPFRETFFRASLVKHKDDPLGKNRGLAANRFNVDGGARVLYLSDQMGTCVEEVQAANFPPFSVGVFPIELELKAVIDLRNPATLAALQLTPNDVAFNFRSLPPGSSPTDTQVLGERCAAILRVDGILFPSFAGQPPTGTNIAVIEATLAVLGSSVAVNDHKNNLFARLP